MIGSGVGEFAIGGFYPARASSSIADPLPGLVSDPLQSREFLLRSTPGAQTVDLSSSGYASLPTDTPYKLFPSAISRPYNFSVELPLSLSAGTAPLTGGASLGIGEILVKNSDGSLDSTALLDWLAEDVDLYIGRKEASISDFTRFCKGTAAGVSWDLNTLSILHKDLRFKLQKRLQPQLYKGFGPCVRGDGVDDRGSATLTCPAGSMTIRLEARAALSSTTQVVANYRNGTSAGLRLIYQNLTHWTFAVRNDAGTVFEATATETIVPGRLDHLEGVLNLTDMKVYLYGPSTSGPTGTSEKPALLAQTAVTGTFNTVLSTLYLLATETSSLFFQGDVDEVAIYSTARTLSEIQSDYDRQLTGTESGLYSYWKMDEGTGTTAANTVPTKPSMTFTGSPVWVGSLEGDTSIAGTPKPILVGIKRQFTPKLVDAQRLVYQWHSGLGQGLDDVLDGGDSYTFGAEVSDLYTTAPSAGIYNVVRSLNGSYFRLGSSPVGVITCAARGDAGGSLGYRDDLAGIHQKTVTQFGGMSDSDLNLDTYAALSLSATASVGFYFDSEINVDAALDEISKKGGSGWWAGDRVGRISVGRIVAPETLTPDVYVTTDDLVDPSKGGAYKRSPIGVRVGKVVLGYRRYNTKLTSDQVAGTVDLATRNDLKEEYRYVTATDPNASPESDTMTVYTEFDDAAEALAEAYRLLYIWNVDRGTYRVTMDRGLLSYFIGTVFHVTVNRYDTAAGKTFVVYGLSEDMGQYGATDRLEPVLFG